MLSEKDIKLTINKLWNEMKNIKLEQNNAVYSVGLRTSQILALMKIIGKEEIFSKAEIDNIQFINSNSFFIKESMLNDKTKKGKPINPNAQMLYPKERV